MNSIDKILADAEAELNKYNQNFSKFQRLLRRKNATGKYLKEVRKFAELADYYIDGLTDSLDDFSVVLMMTRPELWFQGVINFADTPQGYEFWHKMHVRWNQILDSEYVDPIGEFKK